MNNCKCQSCTKAPKNEYNQYCEVREFKNKCASIFPYWRLGISYDAQDDTSRLGMTTYTKQLSISIEQMRQLYESGYRVINIQIKLIDFTKLPFEGHVQDNNAGFNPVIYVEKMTNNKQVKYEYHMQRNDFE